MGAFEKKIRKFILPLVTFLVVLENFNASYKGTTQTRMALEANMGVRTNVSILISGEAPVEAIAAIDKELAVSFRREGKDTKKGNKNDTTQYDHILIQSGQQEEDVKSAATQNNSAASIALAATRTMKCKPWDDNSTDDWWQNHPDWEVSTRDENETHTCFVPIQNEEKAEFFRKVHEIQFHGNCSEVQHRFLVGSGFAASMNFLMPMFWTAFLTNRPFQRSKHFRGFRWIYSPPYNETNPESNSWASCESQDMFCYFLPISSCDYTENVSHEPNRWLVKRTQNDPLSAKHFDWLVSYMMRPRQIVRKKLFHLLNKAAPDIPSTSSSPFCTAMHVRRTDATTEQKHHKRNFYPLSMYLEKGDVREGSNILLLTDDQSSIDEAHALHPEYNWHYVNRTRLRGNHGKNKHIPSGDHGLEVLYILAEFRLVQNCDTLIHGTSNMVTYFIHSMKEKEKTHIKTVQIDKDINWKEEPSIKGDVFIKNLDKILQNNTSSLRKSRKV